MKFPTLTALLTLVALSIGVMLPIKSIAADALNVQNFVGRTSQGAGDGSVTDGKGSSASFKVLENITIDKYDNLWVADGEIGTPRIRKVTPDGNVTTLGRTKYPNGSPKDKNWNFSGYTSHTAIYDGKDNIYLACGSMIRGSSSTYMIFGTNYAYDCKGIVAKFNTNGDIVKIFDRAQSQPKLYPYKNPPNNTFGDIFGLAINSNTGYIYATDPYKSAIRQIAPDGTVTTLAGYAGVSGHVDGNGLQARFICPLGITIDKQGTLYVVDLDQSSSSPKQTYIRKITPNGDVSTLTTISMDNTSNWGQPIGICINNSGMIYVTDNYRNIVKEINPVGQCYTVAGLKDKYGDATGIGTNSRFMFPIGVAVDSKGVVYISEWNNKIMKSTVTSQ